MNDDIAYLISALLLALIATIATTVIAYWHCKTSGTWREWPAGRSLMGLLVIIAVGFGVGAINRFLGPYLAKDFILMGLYLSFAAALVVIGLTIRAELREGKARLEQHHKSGPVDVTVASTNEEKADADV